MSFDTKLVRYCDHKEVEEEHFVSSDHITILLDLPLANQNEIKVRVNDAAWPRNNKKEVLFGEDVTSQADGLNSTFLVSYAPVVDGSNKSQEATRPNDVIVSIKVIDEDASAQFTGTETLLVTQHRKIISDFEVLAARVQPVDVIVKVNAVVVVVKSIEPEFGKIILATPPLPGSVVTVTYNYRARVSAINASSGLVTIIEKPQIGQSVEIFYYRIMNDGWRITSFKTAGNVKYNVVFDMPKQTSNAVSVDEDVSSQFNGSNTKFKTRFGNILPPNAGPKTDSSTTLFTYVYVNVNGEQVIPTNIDSVSGIVDIGFAPSIGSTVLTTYNYRNQNLADLVSIDYFAPSNKCRKCRGTNQINDFDYDNLGKLVTVTKEFKMLQDLRKFIIAVQGSNAAHPWYGTTLIKYIGTARIPEFYIVKFKGEIIDAASKIKDLQNQQTQYQVVTDEEFINFLDDTIVEQSDTNPSLYEITTTIVSQSLSSITLNADLLFNKPLLSSGS